MLPLSQTTDIIKQNTNIYKFFISYISMTRYREVRKWGNSLVIVLTASDVKDLNIKLGDMINIEDAVIKTSISKQSKKELKIK